MNLSRRSFLGGALALMAAPVVAKYIPILPKLVGDGHHDDTAGLNALFAGEPVDIVNDVVRIYDAEPGGSFRLTGGTFRVTDTVRIIRRSNWVIQGGTFMGGGNGGALFAIVDADRGLMLNNRIMADGFDTAIMFLNSKRSEISGNILSLNALPAFPTTQEKAA